MNRLQIFLTGVVACLVLFNSPSAMAQAPQAIPQITPLAAANTYRLSWPGEAGRLYFIQFSTDLQTWSYAPVVELGAGSNIIWDFSSTGQKTFVRLKYSVATNITNGPHGDFDGDGFTNLEEVALYGTDPAVHGDNDGDGMGNDWETLYGLNPQSASDATLDADGDGFTNLHEHALRLNPLSNEYSAGLRTHSFTYDAAARLTVVSGSHSGAFTYDPEGNLTSNQ